LSALHLYLTIAHANALLTAVLMCGALWFESDLPLGRVAALRWSLTLTATCVIMGLCWPGILLSALVSAATEDRG